MMVRDMLQEREPPRPIKCHPNPPKDSAYY
jgi:hypothetical protein